MQASKIFQRLADESSADQIPIITQLVNSRIKKLEFNYEQLASNLVVPSEFSSNLSSEWHNFSTTWRKARDESQRAFDATSGSSSEFLHAAVAMEQHSIAAANIVIAIEEHSRSMENAHSNRQFTAEIVGFLTVLSSVLFFVAPLFVRLKRREEQLRVSNAELARLATIAEKTVNSIIVTDDRCNIVFANDGFSRISGIPAEEAVGQNPFILLQCEKTSAETSAAILNAVQNLQAATFTVLHRHKNGGTYWVEETVEPQFDSHGKHIGFFLFQLDVTKARLADQEIDRARKMLSQSAQLTKVGAWEVDIATGAVRCSPTFREIYELEQDESPSIRRLLKKSQPNLSRKLSRAINSAKN